MKFALLFTLIFNIYSFILMRIDKYRAEHDRIRISEKTLMLHALFFGSIGVLFGMHFPSHHKTQVFKFTLGVPLIMVLEVAAFVYLYLVEF